MADVCIELLAGWAWHLTSEMVAWARCFIALAAAADNLLAAAPHHGTVVVTHAVSKVLCCAVGGMTVLHLVSTYVHSTLRWFESDVHLCCCCKPRQGHLCAAHTSIMYDAEATMLGFCHVLHVTASACFHWRAPSS